MIPPIEEIEVDRIHATIKGSRKASRRDIDVDMNPMVDLAFLLLTFFMLATTFSKPQALELLVPAKPNPDDPVQETPVKESKTLSLVICDDKLVYYRGITDPVKLETSLSTGDLMGVLRSAKTDTEGLVVLVKPLPEARFESIVAVLDALRNADVERYALDQPNAFDLESSSQNTVP